MSKLILLPLVLLVSCSQVQKPVNPDVPKEFSQGELIMGTRLLSKIFDREMAPLPCVPDADEASLLLRTIRPRMDVVQDDMESMLDDDKKVAELINGCEINCSCVFIDELLREHQVILPKDQRKSLTDKIAPQKENKCMTYTQETFCKSELYQTLEREKVDFSFEE